MKRYAFIFGNHPELSLAELKAVWKHVAVQHSQLQNARFTLQQFVCWVDLDAQAGADSGGVGGEGSAADISDFPAQEFMARLGGTIKVVEMIGSYAEQDVVQYLKSLVSQETKFNFGFSEYALMAGGHKSPGDAARKLRDRGIRVKKELRAASIPSRFVESREPVLSSVIVHKERLLKHGAEIVCLKDEAGAVFGRTLAVQPFQEFSQRDYGRPQRDDASGMLPPKLARMMVNISEPAPEHLLYDPFCGSGTVLQEALLLGIERVVGSDKSAKAVQDTVANLEWLGFKGVPVFAADSAKLVSSPELKEIRKESQIDRIVFEGYLGPTTPHHSKISHLQVEMRALYSGFFQQAERILSKKGVIVAALPFWYYGKGRTFLLEIAPLLKQTSLQVEGEFFYRRPQSTVGRHIYVIRKK